jgi:phage shock protein PspC (stress-responsive transcriptional regulator)
VLSGVCGGLARHFDVDPVLIRILVVVITFFTGGAFVLAYLLAWVVIPDDPMWAVAPAPVAVQPTTIAPSYAAGGTGTFVDPATGQVYGAMAAPAPRPARTEPRSYLGLITLSIAAIVGGLLWVLGISGVSVPAVVVAAAMLGVLGVGLLVGAFRGRARWLITPALLLLLITQAASVVPRVVSDTAGAGVGEPRWTPTTSSSQFELAAGDALLDLGSLPTGTSTVEVNVGIGQLRVLIPADTRVVLTGQVGVGNLDLPTGSDKSGTDVVVERTFDPLVTTGDVRIVELNAEVGLGELQVRREAS